MGIGFIKLHTDLDTLPPLPPARPKQWLRPAINTLSFRPMPKLVYCSVGYGILFSCHPSLWNCLTQSWDCKLCKPHILPFFLMPQFVYLSLVVFSKPPSDTHFDSFWTMELLSRRVGCKFLMKLVNWVFESVFSALHTLHSTVLRSTCTIRENASDLSQA